MAPSATAPPHRLIIVSGGQTGVDRAALDAALATGTEVVGWVPRGRMAEDGPIDSRYPGLRETGSDDPAVRTEWNVRDSDGTLLLGRGPLAGGTCWAEFCARRLGRPCLVLDLSAGSLLEWVATAQVWILANGIRRLHVGGPRRSEDPDLYQPALELVTALLGGRSG